MMSNSLSLALVGVVTNKCVQRPYSVHDVLSDFVGDNTNKGKKNLKLFAFGNTVRLDVLIIFIT
jgi:hypothetical protein